MPVSFVNSSVFPKYKCEVNFFSGRRYFPKTEEDAEEMKVQNDPFNNLSQDVQKEILFYLPRECDSKTTVSGSTKGLIQYSHVSQRTRRAVEDLLSRRMIQGEFKNSVIYHFVKNPKGRTAQFRNILASNKETRKIYENPEEIKKVFDIIGFCSENGYKKSRIFRQVSIDLIEFFCQFVESSVENKEMVFQHYLRQFTYMTEEDQRIERHAFDVILIILKKSVEFRKEESISALNALTPGVHARLGFQEEIDKIKRKQESFFETEIVPKINF